MKVKKFEAKTMNEAIAMVKSEMGAEAIILSAKDNSYGLVGGSSVIVTAALSAEAEEKRKFAESHLSHERLMHYKNSSVKSQKQFIEKSVQNFNKKRQSAQQALRMPSKNKYMDMTVEDQRQGLMPVPSYGVDTYQSQTIAKPPQASIVRQAQSQKVYKAEQQREQIRKEQVKKQANNEEVLELKSELARLRSVIENFKQVPQSMVSSHPGAELGLPYEMSDSFSRMQKSGLDIDYIGQLLSDAKRLLDPEQYKNKNLLDAWLVKNMLDSIEVVEENRKQRFQVFVGATGQGKTSTLVKYASHLVLKEKKKIAIINVDTKKLGASDQLAIYAQILNVPFVSIFESRDWDLIAEDLNHVDHVLVDFPGLELQNQEELDFLRCMLPRGAGGRAIHYVQSAVAGTDYLYELGGRYMNIGFDDLIFTNLDSAVNHGIIYNGFRKFNKPLHSFGVGQSMPEDFELASKERVIDLIFKLSKIKTERNEAWL